MDEPTPLVRLSAVCYFMTSSMLVQFTTKVGGGQLRLDSSTKSALAAPLELLPAGGNASTQLRQDTAIAGPLARQGAGNWQHGGSRCHPQPPPSMPAPAPSAQLSLPP